MRRSLGGAGRGMGGGGGGKMITFQRAVGGGAPPNATGNIGGAKAGRAKNLNRKQSSTSLFSSSSPAPFPSLLNFPMAATSAPAWVPSSTVCSDEPEWEYIDMIDDETAARGFYDDSVFGTAPSQDEVHRIVSALQQAKLGEIRNKDVDDGMVISLSESGMEWLEPSHNLYASKMLKRPRSDDMVYDAFHLLETEPSVQRMVVSLSSDKAVWDAVLNNDVVKELRGSIDRVAVEGEGEVEGSEGDGDGNILSWIVSFAKTKMMELLDLITTVVNNVFDNKKGGEEDNNNNGFDGRVKSSFFLSVMVLLVIVLARTKTSGS